MPIVIKKKPKLSAPDPIVAPTQTPRKARALGRQMDGMCRAAVSSAPMSIIAWWLMASYLYYVHDLSLLSDDLYDEMAKDMLRCWGDLKHPHKHLITVDHLQAGSLYNLGELDYPLMTRCAAAHLVKSEWGTKVDVIFPA